MSRKQLVTLFACSMASWAVGSGLMPLSPVYALKLGASQAAAGYYLSFAFAMLAAGNFFAGWLSDRLQRRKLLLIVSGVVCGGTEARRNLRAPGGCVISVRPS